MNMLNNKLFFFLPFLILSAWLVVLTWNRSTDVPKLGYVHADHLFQNYAGSTEAYQDLQAKTMIWSKRLDSLSTAYKAIHTTYTSQKDKRVGEKETELEKQLKQRQTAFENYHKEVEQQRQDIDQEMTQAVVQQINAYISEFAELEGYDMIFTSGPTSNLVYSKEAYNATEEVLKYINKRYKGE